jgi:hypothetical protein
MPFQGDSLGWEFSSIEPQLPKSKTITAVFLTTNLRLSRTRWARTLIGFSGMKKGERSHF